jgi:hypothetical protein
VVYSLSKIIHSFYFKSGLERRLSGGEESEKLEIRSGPEDNGTELDSCEGISKTVFKK